MSGDLSRHPDNTIAIPSQSAQDKDCQSSHIPSDLRHQPPGPSIGSGIASSPNPVIYRDVHAGCLTDLPRLCGQGQQAIPALSQRAPKAQSQVTISQQFEDLSQNSSQEIPVEEPYSGDLGQDIQGESEDCITIESRDHLLRGASHSVLVSELFSDSASFSDGDDGTNIPVPATSLALDMSDAQTADGAGSELSVVERLKQLRARRAMDRGTRSPSVVPSKRTSPTAQAPVQSQTVVGLPVEELRSEAQAPHSIPEVCGPFEHVDTLQSKFTPNPDTVVEPSTEEKTVELNVHRIHSRSGPLEYFVSLPLPSMVRDIYTRRIQEYRDDITTFSHDGNTSSALLARMNDMIDSLKKVTDHQDLINEESATQANIPDSMQARWAESCSTKCYFLRAFLDAMRLTEGLIAVFARPGRMQDILESILKFNNFSYERPEQGSSGGDSSDGMKVVLLPSGSEHDIMTAAVIISFDETYHNARHLASIWGVKDSGQIAPTISLVVPCSAAHIDMCLPTAIDEMERTRLLVHSIQQTKEDVGKPEADDVTPDQAAIAVATWLTTSDDEAQWPLPPLMELDVDIADAAGERVPSASTTQSNDPMISGILEMEQIRSKRTLVCIVMIVL